jgi:hypothetical protein
MEHFSKEEKNMNNVKPVKLTKGSTIGIVSVSAPEAAMEPEWFQRGVMAIEQRFFVVRYIYPSDTNHDLSLTLFMFRVFTNNIKTPSPFDRLTVNTNFLY